MIWDQEDLNQKPLELIENVLDKQFQATLVKGDVDANKLVKDTDQEINLEKYLEKTKFDPRTEINKEKKIESFFQ